VSPARFSVRQHILVNLLFVLVMIGGLVMLGRIPVDFYPDISFNTAQITTIWLGASAEEVERLITTKIEDEIEVVPGIKEIRSRSSPDMSQIEVEWQETLSDDEYDRALADLRGALDRVTDLPESAEEPYLRELSVAEVYASVVVAVVDEGGVGEAALREVARDLRDRLDDLPGVRRVDERGVRDRELRVLLDRSALMAADLTLPEVVQIIRRNNQNVPAGSFTGGRGETIVRATGDFPDATALAATIVKKTRDGTPTRLGDVARVEFGFEKKRLIGNYMGKPAAILNVAKENDADLIKVVRRVRDFIGERQPFLPAGTRAVVTFDSSDYVVKRLGILLNNLYVGVAVVIAILWLTLGFRNALLAVAAVPFCYLTAVLLFPILHVTINSVSIVGMILVSGMLVDDAIIVMENIYRYVEDGHPIREAIILGADEVMWPVICAVTTTIAAFAPLLLISGVSGEFMSILPKTVIICLTASLVECLFTLPAHYLRLGSGRHGDVARTPPGVLGAMHRWSDAVRARVDGLLGRVRDGYVTLLEAALANRGVVAALVGGLALLTVGLGVRLPVDLFTSEYNNFFVSIYGPTTFGIEDTEAVMREVDALLADFVPDELRDYSTYAGVTMNPDTLPIAGPHLGVAFLTLANTRENREDPDRVIQKVKARVDRWWAENPAKATNVLTLPPRDGPPAGKPVAVQIRADDYGVAEEIAGQMKAFLAGIPGAYNVEDNLLPGPREVRLVMDELRASIHGLTFQDLALALQGANDGIVASTFKPADSDEDIDIRVLFEERYRSSEHELLQTEIRTPRGYRVKLADVGHLEVGRSFLSLGHHDTRRSIIVYADVLEGTATSESVNRLLRARFADLKTRYPNVEVIYGGEFQETQRAFSDTFRVLPLAVLLIYVLLAAQFGSYGQPFIVLLAVPFGVIGVILGLAVFGYPLSFGATYVIVGLSGVVVNDSLILVDFVNRARAGGMPLHEAVIHSAKTRFRPVLLTTTTTVGALLPTALGLFGRSLSFGALAAAFATGLSLATVFTLLVVPTAYYATARIGERHRRTEAGVAATDARRAG